MLFSSLEFILLFLPVTLAVYFIIPRKWGLRNYWLLAASLFFYAWGEPKFVLIMIGSIIMNYLMALFIEKSGKIKRLKKLLLILTVAGNLGVLFVFKYLNFITATANEWFPSLDGVIPVTSIALPIGISFFTFQALSYVIDVYRGVPAQKNIGYLGLYISLFPQLIAGPIVRYTTVMDQIADRRITLDSFSQGMMRFMAGFSKKVLLANVLAETADMAFAAGGNSVCMAWLGVFCYTLQIYFDFSGYSDMAIGLGRMFGFRFLENFDYPYISGTVTEFWRRWHISLGSWFRDYVYFPMGGSRVGRGRLIRNLFIVWLLTGIWHGANWTFILWGVLYGVVITAEKLTGAAKRAPDWEIWKKVIYHIVTLVIVMLGWTLFRADNISSAWNYMRDMFGMNGNAFIDGTFIFRIREYAVPLAAGVLFSTPVLIMIRKKVCAANEKAGAALQTACYIALTLLFFFGISSLVMNAHNPFIYFNF